jgi:predicted amidohydrolase YtcJ
MVQKLTRNFCALLLAPALALAEAPADLVIWNGTIYTANPQQQVVDAIAVRGDRIAYVGDRAGAEVLVGEDTTVVDLAGRMALPGLHDVHIHPVLALERMTCALPERNEFSLEQVVDHLQDCLRELGDRAPAPGEWITVSQFNGYGADAPAYLGRYASVRDGLNAVSSKHKLFLSGADGHVYAANDYALANGATLNGRHVPVNAETLEGELAAYREYFQLNAEGRLSGIVADAGAYDLFDYEQESARSLASRADDFNAYFHSAGITTVQEAWAKPRDVETYERMARDNSLDVRMTLAINLLKDKHLDAQGLVRRDIFLDEVKTIRERLSAYPDLKADSVKLMVDGVIEHPTQTAAMHQHYLQASWDDDGDIAYSVDRSACSAQKAPCEGFGYGIMEFQAGDLGRLVVELDKADFTVHFHAIGDLAVSTVLDAIEGARRTNPGSALPHNVAHFQQVQLEDLPRFGAAGAYITPTLSWQAPWPEYDRTIIPYMDEHRNVFDPNDLYDQDTDYMRKLYPVKSLVQGGAVMSAGSDAPVDGPLPRPFTDIMYGLIRGGWVPDPNGGEYWAALNRDQRMRIEDLIDAYTINGARALRQDHLTGSLEVGKKADLVIINQDIIAAAHTLGKDGPEKDFTPEAYGICDHWWAEHCRTRVEQTYFDGRRVWPPQD